MPKKPSPEALLQKGLSLEKSVCEVLRNASSPDDTALGEVVGELARWFNDADRSLRDTPRYRPRFLDSLCEHARIPLEVKRPDLWGNVDLFQGYMQLAFDRLRFEAEVNEQARLHPWDPFKPIEYCIEAVANASTKNDLLELAPEVTVALSVKEDSARHSVERARIRLQRTSLIEEAERHRRLEMSKAEAQKAAKELFDAYAEVYWSANRLSPESFSTLLPTISMRVEQICLCPELPGLAPLIREVNERKSSDWVNRASWEMKVANSDVWDRFHEKFYYLSDDDHYPDARITLTALGDYTATDQETGAWTLAEGINQRTRPAFERLATRAATMLEPSLDCRELDFWLHRVFLHLSETDNSLLVGGQIDEHRLIKDVCDASADFCSRLKKIALENENWRPPSIRGEVKNEEAVKRDSKSQVGDITIEPHTSPKLMAEAMARAMETREAGADGEPSEGAVSVGQFPKRATWLKAKLEEREWNKHNLQQSGGPEHRTTQKILDGLNVQEDVLRKVLAGLRSKQTHKGFNLLPLTEQDIPND